MDGNGWTRAARFALSAVVLTAGAACSGKMGGEPPPASESYDPGPPQGTYSPPPASEGQRTREMEAKQAEMNKRLEDAKAGGMTPEELEQAYKDYERDRSELNKLSQDAQQPPAEAPADAPAADYPPPPDN